MSADRLKKSMYGEQEMYPMFFKGEYEPEPMIVFYHNAEDIINHFPDVSPDEVASIAECSADIFDAATHNAQVISDQDLTVPVMPIKKGIAWAVDPEDCSNIIDVHSRDTICTLADDEFMISNGKLITQGRQAIHCLYAIHYVLQRNFVFDPSKNTEICQWIVNILKGSGYENVMPIE